ncbi:uncharacterized protein LOC101211532 isoform X2 [Cucumis sativus]|uniref:uncharacterized protein LOC101211532 isoform X2 n=1 Tax=Cucumis sativus TaxID=3659 RepID=UPI0012F4FFA6|nr:uncharacterized protein LOC101211532 isoform X2 [Cucumis sativus]KAE8651922.1 hypothetical protein Csa_006065 [Cucumis sativus]
MTLGGEKCLRLSRLVDHCLHPFTEEDGVVLESKGKEKELLIALSHVVTEVQRWVREIDGDSDNEGIQMPNSHEKRSDEQDQSLESHHYMTKIVSELVPLLAFENKYVKHLVGNVLTAVTKFIFLTGNASDWCELVHSLCFSMELVLARIISSPAPSITGSENLDFYLSILQPKLKNANFSTVAGLLQVLRNTLKFLKQEQSDLIGELFDSVNSCLSKIPWDLLGRILTEKICNIVEVQSNDDACSDNLHQRQGLKFLFLGNFVQFLCSLAEPSDFEEASCGSFKSHPLLGTIINLIPNLFDWCLNNQVDHFDRCLSRYFSHKLLILMIRLSFHCHLQCSTLVLWLQLCRNCFQNLLLLPKLELESTADTSLEDSPLIVSYFGDKRSPCSLHLRRLAVFLFLRCSLSFICKQPTEKCDPSIAIKSQLIYTTTLESKCDDCTCSKKGVLELYKWLLGNLPTNIFLDTNMYAKNCTKFASSFLQLYMHEDDLLFKVLLQLLRLPSHTEPCSSEGPSQEVKEVILFHVSNIFDPQHMFHIFLKELNYDHEMLLDYLMSKDAGIYCLEYLLRCLHIINDSRHALGDSSTILDILTDSSGKRRKVMLNSSTISEERLSGSLNQSNETLPSFEDTGNYDYGYKPQRVGVESLKKSKNCLHSLKTSLENLHRENLFPYNPKVLIKRYACLHDALLI